MKSRLLVAAIGIPLILWVILWAPFIVLKLVLALLAAIGAYELMKCVNSHPYSCAGIAIAAGIALAWRQYCEILLVAYVLFVFLRAVIKAGEIKWQELATSVFCLVVIPYGFSAFLRLSDVGYHRAVLLLPLIFSFASDTGAFFAGLTLGKHKLAPVLSPKKTIEGLVGGIVSNLVLSILFVLIYSLSVEGVESVSYLLVILVAVLGSLVSVVGDLFASAIKRYYKIKDYGNIMPGHGGVLDRFDSMLMVTAYMVMIMQVFTLVR